MLLFQVGDNTLHQGGHRTGENMQIKNMCVKCHRLAKKAETIPTDDGYVIHNYGFGCRKGEKAPEPTRETIETKAVLVVDATPEPKKKLVAVVEGQRIFKTGSINGLAHALLMAGVVKIQPSA